MISGWIAEIIKEEYNNLEGTRTKGKINIGSNIEDINYVLLSFLLNHQTHNVVAEQLFASL